MSLPTSFDPFVPPPGFAIENTRPLFILLLILVAAVAVMLLIVPGIGFGLRTALLLATAGVGIRIVGRHGRAGSDRITRLQPLGEGFWRFESANGHCWVGRQGDAITSPVITILRIGGWPWHRCAVVPAGAMGAETHRLLRRWVRGC